MAVAVTDGEGRVRRCNAALGKLLRTPAGQEIDAGSVETAVGALSGRAFEAFARRTRTVALSRADGSTVQVQVATTPLAEDPADDYRAIHSFAEPDPSTLTADAVTRCDAEGRCTFATASVERVYGRPAGAVTGRPFAALVHPDDRAMVTEAMSQACSVGHATSVTFRNHSDDGATTWIDAVISPVGEGATVCDARDATLRIATEAEARARAERSDREAQHQDGLRRVAMAIAIESDSSAALAMVADEVPRLVGCDVGMVVHIADPASAVVTATGGASLVALGSEIPMSAGSVLARLLAGEDTVRGLCPEIAALHGDEGAAWVVASPVRVGDTLWGAVLATGREGRDVPTGSEARLVRFAELASVAIVAADTRTRLATQATTDPLTSLANHRTFHERLAEEMSRAHRYHRPLALALVDLDHFKRFNDTYGHQAGDQVLAQVAALLNGNARRSEMVARVGGEEFAWLLPETTAATAEQAVERARKMMAAQPAWGDERLTLSAGVCDLTYARDADELYRHADSALYWAKANGRNQSCVYSPAVVDSMSPEERTRRMERSRTLGALRALARAVDAKDTSTNKHSVRVAAMSQRVAIVLGWPRKRAELLRDAALLHDIGKLGVPDAILLKPAALSDEEYDIVKRHAALGAEIASEVLDFEQCGWIRHHHERWDGRGYPDALAADDIPDGARIIAVADAWDVMTSERPYGDVLDVAEATRELQARAGTQFWAPATEALMRVVHGPSVLREAA